MAHAEATAPVGPGDLIAAKYLVDRVLGAGGMGVVVAAHHVHLGQRVAVKFLLSSALQEPSAVGRFMREARAAATIQGEHVARVIDVGELEAGEPYMVMEYLVGQDLSEVLKSHGPLAVPDAVDYVLQACEAVAEAHANGIIHRDLKPANLFLTRRPDGSAVIKVLDFGISKAKPMEGSGESASMTSTSMIMGSPLYMSPEQMKSARNVDARSDIWSLGVVLYELVSGEHAFQAETFPGLIAMIATERPLALTLRRPGIPAALNSVVLRCLEKDPAARPQNMVEFAALLAPLGASSSRVSLERIAGILRLTGSAPSEPCGAPPPATGQAISGRADTGSAWGMTAHLKRSRKLVLAVCGLAATSVALAGFILVSRHNAGSPSTQIPSSGIVSSMQPLAAETADAASSASAQPVASVASSAPSASEPSGSLRVPLARSSSPASSAAPATRSAPRAPVKGAKVHDPLADP